LKVKVKLFGTLGQEIPGYDSLKGLDVDIPVDARVKDLLGHLNIPKEKGFLVTMDNTIAKQTDKLVNEATIQILQALAGG